MNPKETEGQRVFAYTIAGIATTVVNIVSYQTLLLCGIDYKVSNAMAIVLTKFSAYILNKLFVFHTSYSSWAETCKEMMRFLLARSATGIMDFLGLILLVEVFDFPPSSAKYCLLVVVTILNYIFSKLFVFKK